MGRSRAAREKARVAHATNRHRRVTTGKLQATLDWQCKHCSQWFSNKRNGPANHMRRCAATQAFLHRATTQKTVPVSNDGDTSTSLSDSDESSSDSESSTESGSENGSESGGESSNKSSDSSSSESVAKGTRRAKARQSHHDCTSILGLMYN